MTVHGRRVAQAPRHEVLCTAGKCTSDIEDDAPVPLCLRHLHEAYAFVALRMPESVLHAPRLSFDPPDKPSPWRSPALDEPGTVYFIRTGAFIKIGWTSDMPTRMRALKPDDILHTEPGTIRDERRCQAAFRRLNAHGEYFWPEPELLAFIDDLRAKAA